MANSGCPSRCKADAPADSPEQLPTAASQDGRQLARTERFLDHQGRPIDLAVRGGKLDMLEYCRQTETVGPGSAGYGRGGRVLEVTAGP